MPAPSEILFNAIILIRSGEADKLSPILLIGIGSLGSECIRKATEIPNYEQYFEPPRHLGGPSIAIDRPPTRSRHDEHNWAVESAAYMATQSWFYKLRGNLVEIFGAEVDNIDFEKIIVIPETDFMAMGASKFFASKNTSAVFPSLGRSIERDWLGREVHRKFYQNVQPSIFFDARRGLSLGDCIVEAAPSFLATALLGESEAQPVMDKVGARDVWPDDSFPVELLGKHLDSFDIEVRRQVSELCRQLAADAENLESKMEPIERLEHLEQVVYDLATPIIRICEVSRGDISEETVMVPTGIANFDEAIGGLPSNDLLNLIDREADGSSIAVAVQIAKLTMASYWEELPYYHGEVLLFAACDHVEMYNLKDITADEGGVRVISEGALSLSALRLLSRTTKRRTNLRAVIIAGLEQLTREHCTPISKIFADLKELARQMHVPFLLATDTTQITSHHADDQPIIIDWVVELKKAEGAIVFERWATK